LVFEPVPQVLVQEPYLDHPETLQSMGQAKRLQVVDEERIGQTMPPWATSVIMERDLVLEPAVPQEAEQAPYLDQPETLQSTGQATELHDFIEDKGGHVTPPKRTAVMIERVRAAEPVPQVFVQEP
jgi:predicted phage gp36 major capsid-like protein